MPDGQYAHELTELMSVADGDHFVVSDLDAPNILKRTTLATLRSVIGAVPGVDDHSEDESAENPDWNLIAVAGGWVINTNEDITDATFYVIQRYNNNTLTYDNVAFINASDLHVGSQEVGTVTLQAADISVPEYGVFRLLTLYSDLTKSVATSSQADWSIISVLPTWTPSAPTLSSDGYPATVKTNRTVVHTAIKIEAPAGERNRIDGYEVRLTPYDIGAAGWGDPIILPLAELSAANRPVSIFYEIGREHIPATEDFKIDVRALAIQPSRRKGTWSSTQTIDASEGTISLDAPSVNTVFGVPFGARVEFNEATRGSVAAADWDHWLIEYRLDGGGATSITPDGKWYGKTYSLILGPGDATKTIEFRAKAVDSAGVESSYSSWTSAVYTEGDRYLYHRNPSAFQAPWTYHLESATIDPHLIIRRAGVSGAQMPNGEFAGYWDFQGLDDGSNWVTLGSLSVQGTNLSAAGYEGQLRLGLARNGSYDEDLFVLGDDNGTPYINLTQAGEFRMQGTAFINSSGDLAKGIDGIADIIITNPADNEVLAYDSGSGVWINQTAAEASIDLDDLDDVVITGVADNEMLAYDSGSGNWINQTPAEVAIPFDDLSNVVITSVADEDYLIYDSGSSKWVNTVAASIPGVVTIAGGQTIT
ncbi:hypothetical protein LCGC14_1495680, partial [marine sediment metagenome]